MKYNSYNLILTAYNEGIRIKRVVEYYRNFAPLLVIDNFSTDNTTIILENMKVKYVKHQNDGSLQSPEGMKFLASLSNTDYFVHLSCSEFLPAALLDLFNDIALTSKYDMVSSIVKSYTCGEPIPLWGGRFRAINRRIERFFNKNALKYEKIVIHGRFEIENKDKILLLPYDDRYNIIHLRDSDALTLIKKHTDYARVEASQLIKSGRPLSFPMLVKLIVKEFLRFIQIPVKYWGGIAVREIWARIFMHSAIYCFCWELRKKITLSESQQRSDRLWKELVAKQTFEEPDKLIDKKNHVKMDRTEHNI